MDQSGEVVSCASSRSAAGNVGISLPVVPGRGQPMRQSRMSRWRAIVLIAIHVLMVGHLLQWYATGTTVSPIEPSEAMYTLNRGELNAGFLFCAAAILATLVLGRFVCGWGCHFIAYQDLCNWLLKKVGIRPKPLRSRLLVLAPLALAVYMFVWPTIYRVWMGGARPEWTNHLTTDAFWATFPGPVVAVLTVLMAGFAIVYFLGAKGFCTYACPYGGFFGLADKLAAGRILVTDACRGCGHCTAACTSNVVVHEEVALYGMVVDPGCMKCLDCVSVCPNDALHYGFAVPPVGVRPESPRRPRRYDVRLWEELLMLGIGVATLIALRGLYGQIPLLLAMGLAGITAYLSMKLARLAYAANVRLQNVQLRRGGRLRWSGAVFAILAAGWLAFVVHSGAVQLSARRGHEMLASLDIGDEVWSVQGHWWASAPQDKRDVLMVSERHLERADAWGLMPTPGVLEDLVWIYLAADRPADAERAVRRLMRQAPDDAGLCRSLAAVLRKVGKSDEAEAAYRRALRLNRSSIQARDELVGLLQSKARYDEAITLYREAIAAFPDDATWSLKLARLLMDLRRLDAARRALEALLEAHPTSAHGHALLGLTLLRMGNVETGLTHLRTAVTLEPESGETLYNLGMAYLELRRVGEAVSWLERAVALQPDLAAGHYNLAVATYMAGRPLDALPHIRAAIRLDPDDTDARGFLAVLLQEINRRGAGTEEPDQPD